MLDDDEDDISVALDRVAAAIDPQSSIPVSVQLRGALEYGIATGEIAANTRLPSVRKLAATLKLSPVTVSNVYATLQDRGHVTGRKGSGTFVTDRAPPSESDTRRLAAFERQIADLVKTGRALGLSRQDIAFRVSVAPHKTAQPIHILLLGTFLDATKAYADDLRPYLSKTDTVTAISLEQAQDTPHPACDLVICPHTLTSDAQRLFPEQPVVGLTLIPNERTRIALAGISPEATAVAVSYFDDFLPTLKSGINRFAPHLRRVTAVPRDHDGLDDLLTRIDVLIYATGAGYLTQSLRTDQTAIEYRHTPDGLSVESDLRPVIETVRAKKGKKEVRDENM
ncbi:GntR family transcriptional regulator [uncultured Aliiroseovarius sp.]|uniref:GntR family transcriptional regulator n=1 Tax=uncultured Aliiroseovarius sp. TaxID=1658783 RepID=UPI002598CD03|nr:GntR family transcriptional regulator [uncultured Aliiroseovarius sp.]